MVYGIAPSTELGRKTVLDGSLSDFGRADGVTYALRFWLKSIAPFTLLLEDMGDHGDESAATK
jgi:hypothetical protein